ncbi:hypothetical protein [Paraclostridium bifermentans]|uniref:hypothetical protein n=1 Tax=Paraclostridium bifermentans TaxID=1490 RepID=UPI0034DE211A
MEEKENKRQQFSVLKKLEGFSKDYSNLINGFVGILTGFTLIVSMRSIDLSEKSVQESKKAYDLSVNGAKLELKLSNGDGYIDENDTIYVNDSDLNYPIPKYSEYLFIPGESKLINSTVTDAVNILLKNAGFVMSQNIHIQVRFENIYVFITDKNLNKRMDYDGWEYYEEYDGSYSWSGVEEVNSVLDLKTPYQEKVWESKNFDKYIYPGQERHLALFKDNDIYLNGNEGKMIISIVADQSEFIEKEYTIKLKNN